MKKHRLLIALTGFVVTIPLYALVTQKLNIWSKTQWHFAVILFLIYLVKFIYAKMNSRLQVVVLIMGTMIAAGLSGGLAGLIGIEVIWLLIAGISIGVPVAMAQYFAFRLARYDQNDQKLTYIQEVALTIFSCALYPAMVVLPMQLTSLIGFTFVVGIIALLVAFVLFKVLQTAIKQCAHDIEHWRDEDASPQHTGGLFAPLEKSFTMVLTHIRDSITSLQNMGREIKTSSEDLSSVSEQMNASLEEVSSTIQQISRGAQDQSSSISTIAHAIEHLNNLTTSISSQVKMASVSSRRTASSAQQGVDLSKHEAILSKDVFEQTKAIEDKMIRLRDQAIEIKKILDIIAGITEQTDLLALNAAIEAARVGEQGKGFAVVADEIRNLATETQRSSSIVESLILEINNTIHELGELLSSEREKMTESKELAIQTEEQFTGISKAVDLITDMITRINEAASNQASNTKELVKQVEQIAQVAGDTAAATEEVSASVQEQTASMEEFTSTAQMLADFAVKLGDLIKRIQ